MHTYHVFFTPKAGFSDDDVARLIHAFGDSETKENLMLRYDLVKFDNKASFPELFDYHFAAHYRSESERKTALERMSQHYKEEPHLSLMKMSKEFKVAFSVSL